jgi:hypothetical protein
MTRTSARVLLWSPRILGILMSLFLSLFALDAFSEKQPFSESLPAFAIHLVPALVLLAVVAMSWRWEWIGASRSSARLLLTRRSREAESIGFW